MICEYHKGCHTTAIVQWQKRVWLCKRHKLLHFYEPKKVKELIPATVEGLQFRDFIPFEGDIASIVKRFGWDGLYQ